MEHERSYSGSRGSKLRSNAPACALSLNFRLPCVRLGGSDALRSDLGAFRGRSGVVLERPGSIFEAETAVFSTLLRARTRARRTCCYRAETPLKLMFRAHQSCRATRRKRHKIGRKLLCESFGKLFRQGRAKNSSRALSEASWRRPRASRERPKPSRGCSGSLRGPSRVRPRAVLEGSGSAPRAPGSPKVAPRALRSDFCSILGPPGPSRGSPGSCSHNFIVLAILSH